MTTSRDSELAPQTPAHNALSEKPAVPNVTAAPKKADAATPPVITTEGLLDLRGILAASDSISRSREMKERWSEEELTGVSIPAGKRLFDICFASCVLFFLMPVLILCVAAIRLESKGPIFFRQRRVGRRGESFGIFKFRTMVPNGDEVLAAYLASDPQAKLEWEADRKLRKDPRVTRLGSTMRRLSLDELPQFWNVLTGEMSIVGPRPIVAAEVPKYGKRFPYYCAVQPGITGLWQVSGRNDTTYAQRVALDCEYANSVSLKLDFKILLKTIKVVLTAAGAY